jgi:hypothetical protein
MSQQNPSPRKHKIDRPRLKRKFSRALINVMNDMENSSGVPREVRLVNIDDGRKVKPTVLYEYDPVSDDEQE